MRHPVRTILWVILGGGFTFGMIVFVVLVSQSALQVTKSARAAADAEMDRVRTEVGGVPCLDRPSYEIAAPRAGTPAAVHMLAWEREDDRLVRMTTPYWALRAGAWKLNAARLIAPPLEHLAFADIDRCGLGLVVDRRTAGGGRVLIWLE